MSAQVCRERARERPRESAFAGAMALGFAVNVASFLVIQRTNSTTLKLMGTARNAGLVLFSWMFLGDKITGMQCFGYSITLIFFGLYNYFKIYHL